MEEVINMLRMAIRAFENDPLTEFQKSGLERVKESLRILIEPSLPPACDTCDKP